MKNYGQNTSTIHLKNGSKNAIMTEKPRSPHIQEILRNFLKKLNFSINVEMRSLENYHGIHGDLGAAAAVHHIE